GHRLHHERVRAADRLAVPHEDLSVGEVVRVHRRGFDAKHRADLLGQRRVPTTGQEHKGLAVLRDDAAHRLACFRSSPLVGTRQSWAAGPDSAGGGSTGWDASRWTRSRWASAAASADTVPGRLRSTQPSTLRCWPPLTARAPGGTSLVM